MLCKYILHILSAPKSTRHRTPRISISVPSASFINSCRSPAETGLASLTPPPTPTSGRSCFRFSAKNILLSSSQISRLIALCSSTSCFCFRFSLSRSAIISFIARSLAGYWSFPKQQNSKTREKAGSKTETGPRRRWRRWSTNDPISNLVARKSGTTPLNTGDIAPVGVIGVSHSYGPSPRYLGLMTQLGMESSQIRLKSTE